MKPRIMCLSEDTDTRFQWVSVGWFNYDAQKRPANQALMEKAEACVSKGNNVQDVIKLLEEAGFEVMRR